ncbi:MAG: hypothetical protein V1721_05990 [Pseudomonadota bacterium]
MPLTRYYTHAGRDPLESARFRTVSNEEQLEYVVPQHWNQAAVGVLLDKIFYPESLPMTMQRVAEPGVPARLRRSEAEGAARGDLPGERAERDIRDVLHRVAGALAYQGWKTGLFASGEEAEIFYDEFRHILLHQIAAPEISQWGLLGLGWAYGLKGAARFTPRHRIVSFGSGVAKAAEGAGVVVPSGAPGKNMLKRIRILGETLALEPEETKTGITLPVENPDSPDFVSWKRDSDIRQVSGDLGRRTLETAVYHVMDACDRDGFFGFDPERTPKLRQAMEEARRSGLGEAAIRMALSYAEQGYEEISFYLPEEEKTAAQVLRTTLSVPDDFMEAALTGHSFLLDTKRHYPAQKMWDALAEAVWSSGEPAVSFRNSIESASPVAETGRSLSCDATGGFAFLPDSEAPSATINLLACALSGGIVDIPALRHVTRVMTMALEAAEDMAATSPLTREYRPILLGMTNMAALLMSRGIAYDSDAGRATAALAAGLVSGVAHQVSASIAASMEAFPAYPLVARGCLQNIMDKTAALSGTSLSQKSMTRRPAQMKASLCPDPALVGAVKQAWEDACRMGWETGFRHAHMTGMDTDPAVQALLGAQTQDIMPESTLVRFEGYFSDTLETAQLYGKKFNPLVSRALLALGYSAAESDDIHFYAVGHGTLLDAPHVNHESLREKGFPRAALDAVEQALATALHIRYAFNKWTLGEDFCLRGLGFSEEELENGAFDMLEALGFSGEQIEEANVYCCGTMTLEGAPHLNPAHLGVFDCVSPCGSSGVRRVTPEAQIRMQAAVEPFLSGALAHTVMLGHHVTIEDVQKLILSGWEMGVKNLRLYRDNCSLLHPAALPVRKKETGISIEENQPVPIKLVKVRS